MNEFGYIILMLIKMKGGFQIMESMVIDPPVVVETRAESELAEKEFKRKKDDTQRRFDQAWVCGNSRMVAKISYELDALKLEAKENGFEW